MIYLITGVPGSGKTLYAIRLILEWQKQGRTVYADIDGINIPNVLPSPQDWRDTPEGSVVIYDECQKIFPSTGRAGVAEDERLRALETHRHSGHDLVFITQAPTFVHHHIRKLVGKHIHAFRAMGLQGATLFKWDGVCDAPNGYHERKQADSERWAYPKDLFQYYKSATVHTHKFKMPRKILLIGGFALVAIIGALIYGMNSGLAKTIEHTEQTESATKAHSAPVAGSYTYNNTSLQEVHNAAVANRSISGCVSGVHCRCFDNEGFLLDLEPKICRDMASGLLALPIRISSGESSRREESKKTETVQSAASPSTWLSGSNAPPNKIGHPEQGKVW